MTIGQLIEELKQFPESATVYVSDYMCEECFDCSVQDYDEGLSAAIISPNSDIPAVDLREYLE